MLLPHFEPVVLKSARIDWTYLIKLYFYFFHRLNSIKLVNVKCV